MTQESHEIEMFG